MYFPVKLSIKLFNGVVIDVGVSCKAQKVYIADLVVCSCGTITHKPVSLGGKEYLTYFKGAIAQERTFKLSCGNGIVELCGLINRLSEETNQEIDYVKHVLRLIITDFNKRHNNGSISNFGECN